MITNWHHEACQVMTNGDPEGQIILSHPNTINGFLFLLTITKYHILCCIKVHQKFLGYDIMTSLNITLTSLSSNTANVQSPQVTAWVK